MPPEPALSVRRSPYLVTGSTAEHLRLMTNARGPSRDDRRFRAYTDWVVTWRCTTGLAAGRHVVEGLDVSVDATLTLPRWAPPPWAPAALVDAWRAYVDALERHEQGHVELAASAARDVRDALLALPGFETEEELASAVERAAASAIGAARERERAYDDATGHGATQGVRFPTEG